MAISLLQDAQQRSLAAALASINREDIDRSLSMSPPMSANTSSSSNAAANAAAAAAMYPGLQQAAAASAFGMLSPQLFAANRQVAAAFMASHLPMPSLASTLFPHHPALFSSWGNPTPHMPLSSGPHSPPASPHSPLSTSHNATASTPASSGKQSLSMISPTACSQSGEMPPKKVRKTLSVKKEFITPSTIEVSMSVADLYHHTPSGPISPPSSGSSPNSTHDGAAGHKDPHKDPARDKSFTCKTCSRSFGYKHVLQNHERTHTGEKPFECPECHKRFTRDHHLKTHMRLHTGEKPYHCSHCDRQFVQVANLRRHLRVHTGERPYTCEICNGKFSDSNQLKSHMLVHNGEKPFACERCHMKFRRRHHLMNHKCGNNNNQHSQSPPTPAISPAMSADYPMCDQKSALGSVYGSEESLDLIAAHHNTTTTKPHYEAKAAAMGGGGNDAPLDLSEDGASSIDGGGSGRLRKVHDIRRVFRLPPQISHIPTEMPVQTEPEDLSMHSPRSCTSSTAGPPTQLLVESPESLVALHHDDFDLDELDDAATLYMRQQQLAAMKRSMQLE